MHPFADAAPVSWYLTSQPCLHMHTYITYIHVSLYAGAALQPCQPLCRLLQTDSGLHTDTIYVLVDGYT
jgi:hypothetical protein